MSDAPYQAQRDQVFTDAQRGARKFSFDESVAAAFDNMAQRSIPGYEEAVRTTCWLIARDFSGGTIFDLGASTGTLELSLGPWLKENLTKVVAVDLSEPMVEIGRKRTADAGLSNFVEWRVEDIAQTPIVDAGMVVCNYVIQFTNPEERTNLYRKIWEGMRPGAWLVLSEKTVEDGATEEFFRARYEDFKRTQGYSEEEIENKRRALEGVLRPWSVQKTEHVLGEVGFEQITLLIRWWNFVTWVARKPG